MLKKKILAVLTAMAIIICTLSSCAGKNADIKRFGDEAGDRTLRVCVDSGSSDIDYVDERTLTTIYDKMAEEIKNTCGIEKIVFEILPGEGPERETALQRIRTEIMSGGGPDVFLVNTMTDPPHGGTKNSLFNYPEKNMETGVFLPLDTYMENNTQFTDWNMQTKAVLDAGRTEEGQLIIPLIYTFPILVYPESEVHMPYTTELTMQDVLDNPKTSDIGTVLYSGLTKTDAAGRQAYRGVYQYIFSLGKLADFESEELLFTEDELYEILAAANELGAEIDKNELSYLECNANYYDLIYSVFNGYFDTDMALVPLYSIDGGVTVSVRSFAAVNRNTDFPEEAFSVIDYFMSEDAQRRSELYSYVLAQGLPLQNDLGHEGKTLRADDLVQRYLDEPYFEDLLEIKDQITAVNFQNELDSVLGQLQYECNSKGMVLRENVADTYKKLERMIGE